MKSNIVLVISAVHMNTMEINLMPFCVWHNFISKNLHIHRECVYIIHSVCLFSVVLGSNMKLGLDIQSNQLCYSILYTALYSVANFRNKKAFGGNNYPSHSLYNLI